MADVRIDHVDHAGVRIVGVRTLREADAQVLYELQALVRVQPVTPLFWTSPAPIGCTRLPGRLLPRRRLQRSALRFARCFHRCSRTDARHLTAHPAWTPQLDTAIGGTRTPVQLIGIADDGEGYVCDFSRLGRWLALCRRHGIITIEVAHLFTRWGAKAAPAFYVQTPTGVEHRFGWHVPATDPNYRGLLE